MCKIQPKSKIDKVSVRNVLNEASFMQPVQGQVGIPFMHWSGVNDPEIAMIVEYLGDTIAEKL